MKHEHELRIAIAYDALLRLMTERSSYIPHKYQNVNKRGAAIYRIISKVLVILTD